MRLALLSSITVAGPLLVPVFAAPNDQESTHSRERPTGAVTAKLVDTVRYATRQFVNANAVAAANYQPLFGCVSGPDHGAMGVHYINLTLVGDGEIDASRPEAVIYELWQGGLRLVGVEYIVNTATWNAHHNAPPMLEGQAFQLVTSPNRFGLPAFMSCMCGLTGQ